MLKIVVEVRFLGVQEIKQRFVLQLTNDYMYFLKTVKVLRVTGNTPYMQWLQELMQGWRYMY